MSIANLAVRGYKLLDSDRSEINKTENKMVALQQKLHTMELIKVAHPK